MVVLGGMDKAISLGIYAVFTRLEWEENRRNAPHLDSPAGAIL